MMAETEKTRLPPALLCARLQDATPDQIINLALDQIGRNSSWGIAVCADLDQAIQVTQGLSRNRGLNLGCVVLVLPSRHRSTLSEYLIRSYLDVDDHYDDHTRCCGGRSGDHKKGGRSRPS